jgi:hypothetical protein
MYVIVTGSKLSRLYFITFLMFGVLMAYNMVIASIIECVVALAERKKQQS